MNRKVSTNLADNLAIDRTKLANERTFLSYFRTAVVFLSSGVAIIELEFLSDVKYLGVFLLVISPMVFIVGIHRFLTMKKRINDYYKPT